MRASAHFRRPRRLRSRRGTRLKACADEGFRARGWSGPKAGGKEGSRRRERAIPAEAHKAAASEVPRSTGAVRVTGCSRGPGQTRFDGSPREKASGNRRGSGGQCWGPLACAAPAERVGMQASRTVGESCWRGCGSPRAKASGNRGGAAGSVGDRWHARPRQRGLGCRPRELLVAVAGAAAAALAKRRVETGGGAAGTVGDRWLPGASRPSRADQNARGFSFVLMSRRVPGAASKIAVPQGTGRAMPGRAFGAKAGDRRVGDVW